jgi:hypothetical protein
LIHELQKREVVSVGVVASRGFEISQEHGAHVMSILRDTLYSDKILAVLREYSSNAWDAHRMSGKGDVPIRVRLPTQLEPVLTIRDFGPGLSHEDAFNVFTQYGNSTKRGSNDAVGALGIGSKSGFAYSDSFTVTSWHGGKKRVYSAALDPSNKGRFDLLFEGESEEETGLEVLLPVRQEDFAAFHAKAGTLFPYFVPQPDINMSLASLYGEACADCLISLSTSRGGGRREDGWVALMGCVPYVVRLEALLQFKHMDVEPLGTWVHRYCGLLRFGIGELSIAASREELKYDETTQLALHRKLNQLITEFTQGRLAAIDSSQLQGWNRRQYVRELASASLPIPAKWQYLTSDSVNVGVKGQAPRLFAGGSADETIEIQDSFTLYLKDTNKNIRGYQTNDRYRPRLIVPVGKETPDQALEAMQSVLKKHELDGVQILRLSALPWTDPRSRAVTVSRSEDQFDSPVDSSKHKLKLFRLKRGLRGYHYPWSNCWEAVSRAPTQEDVYVLLRRFEVRDPRSFYGKYIQDSAMIAALHPATQMPEIYGYKVTEKDDKTQARVGKPYAQWRMEVAKQIVTPALTSDWQKLMWMDACAALSNAKNALQVAHASLGSSHPLTEFARQCTAKPPKLAFSDQIYWLFDTVNGTRRLVLRAHASVVDREACLKLPIVPEYAVALSELLKKYPLLQQSTLHGTIRLTEDWLDYIKAMDQLSELKEKANGNRPASAVLPDKRQRHRRDRRPAADGS